MNIQDDILNDYLSDYEKVKKEYKLTYKQYQFANYYITSNNGVLSARKAGYNGNNNSLKVTASSTLKKDNVQRYIKDKRLTITNHNDENLVKNSNFGMNEVIQKYIELINNCENPSVVRAALSDLTKIYGGFKPTEIDVKQTIDYSLVLQSARQRLIDSQNVVTIENQPLQIQ